MLVTIHKRPNLASMPKKGEFVHEYLEYELLKAIDAIADAIHDYCIISEPDGLTPDKKEEIKSLRTMQPGDYAFNVGYYTYHITIEDEY